MAGVLTIDEVSTLLKLRDRDHRAIHGLIRKGLLTPIPGLKRPLRFTGENVEAFMRGDTQTPAKRRRTAAAASTGEPEWLRDVPRVFRTGKGKKR